MRHRRNGLVARLRHRLDQSLQNPDAGRAILGRPNLCQGVELLGRQRADPALVVAAFAHDPGQQAVADDLEMLSAGRRELENAEPVAQRRGQTGNVVAGGQAN